MRRTWQQGVSLFVIWLLLIQPVCGSVTVFANINETLQVTITTENAPYIEGTIATNPVTVQVTATTADSANVQVELSKDEGNTWTAFSISELLIVKDEGDHAIWFRVVGQPTIYKHLIRIAAPQPILSAKGNIIYVNADVTSGIKDGKSWANAFDNLQSALDIAQSGQQIWLAAGIYKPSKEIGGVGARYATFQMKNNVVIYGGYSGTETDVTQRDWKVNKTILSGDIGIEGDNTDNAYHVFYHPSGLNLNATAILDGVTITDGNANNGYPNNHDIGGGMYNSHSSPMLMNVEFRANIADVDGAGMYNRQSSPTLANIVFSANKAGIYGGGMSNWMSNPTLTNITFDANIARSQGGGMFNGNSSPTLTNVMFNANTAESGGGMFNVYSSPTLTNITFSENTAGNGGGMSNDNSQGPTLTNVIFSGNIAQNQGGGMFNFHSSLNLTNITISGNKSTGNVKSAIYGGSGFVRNSVIVGNHNEPAFFDYFGTIEDSLLDMGGNIARFYKTTMDIDADTYTPEDIFIDPSQQDYRLRAKSPAIDKGMDRFNSTPTDLAGNKRIQGGVIDLGAYEAFLNNVTYEKNGATGDVPVDKETYDQGHSVTIQENSGNLVMMGHTFAGWNTQADGKGTAYMPNDTFQMGNTKATLYAQWTVKPTYTVQYEANGAISGTVPQDNTLYEEKEKVTVQSNSGNLEKAGHTFAGWNTQADGKGIAYMPNDTFQMGKAKVILYTQWTEKPTYTVQYDGNGATSGTVPQDKTLYEEKGNVTVQSNSGKLVKTGHTFAGWNTQVDSKGTHYAENAAFLMGKADITLYAEWKASPPITGDSTTLPATSNDNDYSPPLPVKVTFQTNGGISIEPIEITSNTKVSIPPVPTREGYRFDGWYQDKALTKPWAKEMLVKENLTLFAKWTALQVEEAEASKALQLNKPSVVTFQDIENHWAQEMIEALATQGIIKGYSDGTFRPNESISRQHVAALFTRAFDFNAIRTTTAFSDVAPNHMYYEEITILQQAGIVDGADEAFRPTDNITRAQFAKILANTLQLKPEGTVSFVDVDSRHWSAGYIAALEGAEIALGDNGKFRPEASVTRAQLATFLYRAIHQ